MTNITIEQCQAIDNAVGKINAWLSIFGLTAAAAAEELPEGILGEYEKGSVFEKEIQLKVNPKGIKRYCKEESVWEEVDEIEQLKLTVFHEAGHAIMEQITDWMETWPQLYDEFKDEFLEIVDDEFDEETVVEDFARSFLLKSSESNETKLQQCFRKMHSRACEISDRS